MMYFILQNLGLDLWIKIFIIIGSIVSIGFGLWHFFVPKKWKWDSYIDKRATELVVAVRAINVFFSLSLVLFGVVNILFIYGDQSNRYSIMVMLAATCVLWLTRIGYQIIYPQGTINPVLRYGMLIAFILVFLCYVIPLYFMVTQNLDV